MYSMCKHLLQFNGQNSKYCIVNLSWQFHFKQKLLVAYVLCLLTFSAGNWVHVSCRSEMADDTNMSTQQCLLVIYVHMVGIHKMVCYLQVPDHIDGSLQERRNSTGDHDSSGVNTLRPRQNCRHFPDDIFKCIFFNENVWISIKIAMKFVPKGPNNNIPALVQIMAWHRPGDKPLSEPMVVSLPTHICVARPLWVNTVWAVIKQSFFSQIITPHQGEIWDVFWGFKLWYILCLGHCNGVCIIMLYWTMI